MAWSNGEEPTSLVKLKLSRNVRTFPPGRWKIQMKALKRLNPLCGQMSCWDGSKMQAGTKLAWMSWIRLELTMITMGSWLCRVAFWIIFFGCVGHWTHVITRHPSGCDKGWVIASALPPLENSFSAWCVCQNKLRKRSLDELCIFFESVFLLETSRLRSLHNRA